MSSERVNRQFKEPPKPREPEKVLTIQPGREDDILNPVKGEAPKPAGIPKPDDPAHMKPLEDWMADAIHSREPLVVTDDPALAGTRVVDAQVAPTGVPANVPAPLQAAFDDLNVTRLEKRELLDQARLTKSSLAVEREYYRNQRQRRAIPVPAVPSGCATYPEGALISYSPYSVADIEAINNPDVPLYQKYEIMLEGIYTLGMSPLELTFSDFTFIGDTRHLQSLGDSSFRYPYVCKSCGRPGIAEFHLSDVSFTTLEDIELPLKVRFHTFPDEIFVFMPHTIGDVMHLIKTDRYWRKMGAEYLVTDEGNQIIDTMAVNACRCVSHPWEVSYFNFLQASENPEDRAIMRELGKALYHGSDPIKFRCRIPLDKTKQKEMAAVTADIVQGVMSGELSTETPNPDTEMPKWMEAHLDAPATKKGGIKVCGAENTVDVVAGDILIPFRRTPVNLEYGILP